MTSPDTPDTGVGTPLNAENVGRRVITFDNGRHEDVYAVAVDHPSGRWEQVWALRSSEMADRVAAALNAARPATDPAGLTFAGFAETNRTRCESADGFGHPLSGWTLSDWFTAATGEFGEAANKAKKLNRYRDGIPGNTETEDELRAGLADEIADTVIYLDLLAQAAGFDLGAAVVSKFNRTSEKIGSPTRLSVADGPGPEER